MENKKYKIGYTTGVYDLFHIGHLNILKNAKAQCDYLIVGVSTDELVKEYKGKDTVIPFAERMEIVKSICYVDEVVPQYTLDKISAWESLHFDAVFHGDDWKGSTLYSNIEERLQEVGVEMVFLPHTDGTSTTEIFNKVRGNN